VTRARQDEPSGPQPPESASGRLVLVAALGFAALVLLLVASAPVLARRPRGLGALARPLAGDGVRFASRLSTRVAADRSAGASAREKVRTGAAARPDPRGLHVPVILGATALSREARALGDQILKLPLKLSGASIASVMARSRRILRGDEAAASTRADLYDQARSLGISGRARMDKQELAEAIRRTGGRLGKRRGGRHPRALALVSHLRRHGLFSGAGLSLATLRISRPAQALMLSVAALATGGLGLMVAYAVAPDEDVGSVLVAGGGTPRLLTVTGPGGTTTVAVTKTKQGKTKLIPVRVVRTITGPGGTRTVAVDVLGPPITVTDVRVVTRVRPVTVVQTNVITDVVTKSETVVVTETVFVEVTTTLPP
jgi:Rho termination factor, N-terminal domain